MQYMCRGALPFDRAGTLALPAMPDRVLVEHYLNSKNIPSDLLTEFFSGQVSKFLESIAQRDYAALESITEKRFFAKLSE